MSKEITVKEFCDGYNKLATESLKDIYLRDNLVITPYIPFVRKMAVANNLVKITMHDSEGNIHVNSAHTYLFFMKSVIEEYTNLLSTALNFADDYDELKKSGILDRIIIGDKNRNIAPLVNPSELDELKSVLDMRKSDLMTNEYEPHAFITNQIGRFKTLGEATLTPFINALNDKLDSLSKEDIEEIAKKLKKGNFKEV